MKRNMASSSNCELEVDENIDKKSPKPLLVQFSNGQLKPDSSDLINFSLYSNKTEEDKKILVAETDHLTYQGSNYDNSSEANNLYRYYVGVLDKNTGKMKVYDSELFHLKPILKDPEESLNATAQNESTDFQKQADDLTIAFGSQRKRRAIESKRKYNVADEQLHELMQQTAVDVNLDEIGFKKFEGSESLENELLPVNRMATKLEDVYNLEDIISSKEFEILDEAIEEWQEFSATDLATWKKENKYPYLILKNLENLPQNEEDRIRKLKLLMYLNYLFMLGKLSYQEIRKKDPLPSSIPFPIRTSLLDRFTQAAKDAHGHFRRTMSTQLKDKVIAQIVALGLVVNNFELNMQDLQSEVKIPIKRWSMITQSLGAKTETKNSVMTIKLKLPLPRASKRILKTRPKRK